LITPLPFGLGKSRKARQGVAVKGIRFPGGAIPWAVLIAEDLDGENAAFAAELIGRGDAVVENAVGFDAEFDRARQVIIPEQLEFILARIFIERIESAEHAGSLAGFIPAAHVSESADNARPFRFLRHVVGHVLKARGPESTVSPGNWESSIHG